MLDTCDDCGSRCCVVRCSTCKLMLCKAHHACPKRESGDQLVVYQDTRYTNREKTARAGLDYAGS